MEEYPEIVSFTLVRNESDIIESFVRNNLEVVDHMVIVDNLSDDSTRDILGHLVSEGLPLEVLEDKDPVHDQSLKVTQGLRYCREKFDKMSVFVPLDADEFLVGKREELLADYLPNTALSLKRWHYAYNPDEKSSDDPIGRMRKRYVKRDSDKSLLRTDGDVSGYRVGAGSHKIYRNGEEVPSYPTDVVLAHFPLRTRHQFQAKTISGWPSIMLLDRNSMRSKRPIGVHWRKNFEFLKSKNFAPEDDELSEYMLSLDRHREPMEEQPVHTRPLKYSKLVRSVPLLMTAMSDSQSFIEKYWSAVESKELATASVVVDVLCCELSEFSWRRTWIWRDSVPVMEFDSRGSTFAFDIYISHDESTVQLVSRSGAISEEVKVKASQVCGGVSSIAGKPERVVLARVGADLSDGSALKAAKIIAAYLRAVRLVVA